MQLYFHSESGLVSCMVMDHWVSSWTEEVVQTVRKCEYCLIIFYYIVIPSEPSDLEQRTTVAQ